MNAALQRWLADQARPVDVERLADDLASARVAGLAPTTREAQQVADLQADLVLALVDRGTTTVVLQDTTDVGRRLDAWVRDASDEDLPAIQREMWGPWRIEPLARLVRGLRERRRARPDRVVEVRGLSRPTATVADYDAVLEVIADVPQATSIRELLTTIRVAHDGGEHAERAHGRWDGPPFVELARAARELADEALADGPSREAASERLDRIVAFHATSLSQGHDGSDDERRAAVDLLAHLDATGRRAVVWDGLGHLAGTGRAFGTTLRDALGDDYACVLTTFGRGSIRDLLLPTPRADSLDAVLEVVAGGEPVALDLRAPADDAVARVLAGTFLVRLVSGMYDPADDASHYEQVRDLRRAVDVVVHLPRVTPGSFSP